MIPAAALVAPGGLKIGPDVDSGDVRADQQTLTRRPCLQVGPSGPVRSAHARGLLEPERVANWRYPGIAAAEFGGGRITYAIQGSESGPLILYFHGWGDDFRAVLSLEYPLIDAGFRLLVVHRPGYAGTTFEGEVEGKTEDWRSPAGFARAAAALLNRLFGASHWQANVIGTSGGAPTALAFAEFNPEQTTALVIQAGVTEPWTEARFVPELLRDSYRTAFRWFGWAGDYASEIVFGLIVKFRDTFLKDEDRVRALVGSRLEAAKRDPAFLAVISLLLRDDPDNTWGELNDVFEIFFAKSPYCRWEAIKAPTLLLHDPEDHFVPFVHAETAAQRLSKAELRAFHLAGHILWLGPDARRMHDTRVSFLRGG